MPTMLEDLVVHECKPETRAMLLKAIGECTASGEPSRRRFEFNRFEVTLDARTSTARIEDVLDPSEGGELEISLSELEAALRAAGVERASNVIT